MNEKIIAWDLGTGGNKASLYDKDGNCLAATFISYDTAYPDHGYHEQNPLDWFDAVVKSTQLLLAESKVDVNDIVGCGISGHSLVVVPLDKDGNLLRERVPIWSDGRAMKQAENFFKLHSEEEWYLTTGNGFTPALYSAFKLLWHRENEPELFEKIHKVIGTKDYVNFRLTGRICTDPSYASGCGVWDLKKWEYSTKWLERFKLPASIFPEVLASTQVIGTITEEAAKLLGLNPGVKVVAGGVDNSCMALGAKAFKEGRMYNSLGSSSWIAVSSKEPLLEKNARPYVFAHVVPGYFASALCIASGGTTFRWIRDQLCEDLTAQAERTGEDVYDLMTKLAQDSPVGSKKLLFNPSLGGGMPMDKSYNVRGSFMGLDLVHKRPDMIRASMEGITMSLRACLDELHKLTTLDDKMLLVGGGSKSALWRQIYADLYKMDIMKSNIDQQAAALGAAACAAVGVGLWQDFEKIDGLHEIEELVKPIEDNVKLYDKMMEVYYEAAGSLSDIGDKLMSL